MAAHNSLTPQPVSETAQDHAVAQDAPRREARAATAHRALTFTNPALLRAARAKVEQRLAADPEDAKTLRRLADLQRKGGEIGAALATYRKIAALTDDAVAAWGIGALGGEEPLTSAPEGTHPAPFLRVTDFLTAAQQDMLFEALRMGPEHFTPAGVTNDGKSSIDLDFRVASLAERPVKRQIRPWFVEELEHVVHGAVDRFGIDNMHEVHVELNVTAHQGGAFFRPHRDNGSIKDRQISFVYYFHAEPKPFVGGELLLYDTSLAPIRYHHTAFSRIEPVRNSLVIFPSCYFHEVLPVRCESESFEDARFTVNGWLHRASDWEAQQAERAKARALVEAEEERTGEERAEEEEQEKGGAVPNVDASHQPRGPSKKGEVCEHG